MPTIVYHILLLIAAFFFMEFVAWWSHKYIMHGFLWKWHVDHHRKDHQQGLPLETEDKHFEKNDLFFVLYAFPGMLLMILGFAFFYVSLIYISIGITLYGLTYFIIHDIIIHRRIKFLFKGKNYPTYIKAIMNAHTAHHKPKNKDDFHNYGLLIFPIRYFSKK